MAELFADPLRDWPWMPLSPHLLIDRSQVGPQDMRRRLWRRIAHLMTVDP